MTSVITTQRENIPRKLPALPVIEHPLSRLGSKSDLQVRGSSRDDEKLEEGKYGNHSQKIASGALPPVKRNRERGKKSHSRVLTWPFGQDRNKGYGQLPWATNKSALEVEELIKEKLTTGFFGLRQAFKSNDPLGRGNVSREALTTILYHLCGYLSAEQIDGLLHRIQLDTRSTISFDSFIKHFRDVEVVQKEWVDPILRPSVEENTTANLPANRLREKQRKAVANPKESAAKGRQRLPPPKLLSALQVFPLLKKQAAEGSLNILQMFPASCFDTDSMVLKPQLRTALLVLGISMYDEELDKLWDRVDKSGTGAVDSVTFFNILGVGRTERTRRRRRRPSKNKITETVAAKEKEDKELDTKSREENMAETDSAEEKMKKTSPDVAKQGSGEINTSVLKLLSQKFKEGYNNMLQSFLKFDVDKTGKVTRNDFRKVLADYGLQLGAVEIEHLLERCGMRKETMVTYETLLNHFQDRSESGFLQVVMEDSKHRFNQSRDSGIRNTTAVDAEAKILDQLQSDFLSLLAAFKQLDRHRMGVVTRYQFKEMLEARFNLSLSDEQVVSILRQLDVDPSERLVPYPKFLELFSSTRNEKEVANMLSQHPPEARPRTCPTQSPVGYYSPRSLSATKELGRSMSQLEIVRKEQLPRDTNTLLVTIRDLLTEKFHVINKTFLGMDTKKGALDKETFRRLMERHELNLTSAEVDGLWSRLPTDADNMVWFANMVEYCLSLPARNVALSRVLQDYARNFVRKSLATHPEVMEDQKDAEELFPSLITKENLEERSPRLPQINKNKGEKPSFEGVMRKLKNPICSSWNELRDDFQDLDADFTATVLYTEFQDIILKRFQHVTKSECQCLCSKFDRRKNGRVWYLEFLKHFLPAIPVKNGEVVRSGVKQSLQADGPKQEAILDAIVIKIRNKMISDWKSLRRAFKKLDLSGDGFLSVSEFRAALQYLDFPLNEEDFYHIFSTYDANMDGFISYVEFMRRSLAN